MKTQIICRESYFVFQKHTEICPKTNWTIFNLKKGDDLSVYCYRHTTWLGYKGRVKKHFCICVRIQLLFSHSKGTMNICVNSSTPTSQCNAICCNNLQHPFCCHTYRELRPEMSWQRRAEKNKTKINKLKRFIFIWSDYESFTERNVITALVETQLQMRTLWLTSTPALVCRPSITLTAYDCDRGFMNCMAT